MEENLKRIEDKVDQVLKIALRKKEDFTEKLKEELTNAQDLVDTLQVFNDKLQKVNKLLIEFGSQLTKTDMLKICEDFDCIQTFGEIEDLYREYVKKFSVYGNK